MAKYEIFFKRSVYKDLRPIPKADLGRILARIRSLTHDPRPVGCEKLSGQERYRIRQGDYRRDFNTELKQLFCLLDDILNRKSIIAQNVVARGRGAKAIHAKCVALIADIFVPTL